MFIERDAYKDMLDWKANKSKDKTLYVDGARQVGKTTLIMHFGIREFKQFLKLDLATGTIMLYDNGILIYQMIDIKLKNFNDNLLEYLKINVKEFEYKETSCLFIDEIQESKIVFNLVRPLTRDFKFNTIVSGSYLGLALDDLEYFYPVGDVYTLTLTTLNFNEFSRAIEVALDGKNACINKKEIFDLYIKIGGYPKIVTSFIEGKSVRDELIGLVKQFKLEITRYIKDLKFVQSVDEVFRVIFTNMLKEKNDTKSFIEYLQQDLVSNKQLTLKTNDINIITNWFINAGILDFANKSIDADVMSIKPNSKIYFNDVCFLNYFTNVIEDNFAIKGKRYETYAYKVLKDAALKFDLKPVFITYSVNSGELDFCSYNLPNCNKKYGFEIKSGKSEYLTGKLLLKNHKIDELVVFRADMDTTTEHENDDNIEVLPLHEMESYIKKITESSPEIKFSDFFS